MEPREKKLIARYKKIYSIPAEVDITRQMILHHWQLERQLTAELLQSAPGERWGVFDRCYTRLYDELDWLNKFSGDADTAPPAERFARWLQLVGPPPKSVYEIGSGQGDLIVFLARNGHHCKGSEITGKRGEALVADAHPNLSWGRSDGVHLGTFEPAGTYDAVVSDQVIEHLHPDDLNCHLRGVHSILKKGGRYVFNTPNRYTGPHDVSRVFKIAEPQGMHLKEYTNRELAEAVRRAGFVSVHCGFVPRRFRVLVTILGAENFADSDKLGFLFLRIESSVEKILGLLPASALRRWCGTLLCTLGLFSDNVALVAQKG